MVKKFLIFFSLVTFLSVGVASAQKGTLSLQSTAEKQVSVVDEQGKKTTRRVPVSTTSVFPGDEVIFTTHYENIGKETATGVAVTNPVPEHMVYVDGSAEGKGAKIDFSVDGGKTYAPASLLKVKEKSGKERPALVSDYSHIRWSLNKPLVKGGKGSVSFKARVK